MVDNCSLYCLLPLGFTCFLWNFLKIFHSSAMSVANMISVSSTIT